jgi:uncharacterized protein DUF5666
MIRKALFALVLLPAATAFAQNRGRVVPIPFPIPGATIGGIVSAVNGTNVMLANGLITVDVSQATIADDRGARATITPGSLIFAILKSDTSLQASSVVVTTVPQVTLSGPVQSVNPSAGTLQLLGVTIHIDANTSFGGSHNIRSLIDIVANDIVQVQANVAGSSIIASSILVFSTSAQPLPTFLHGTVKSIGADSWVITDSRRGDTTVLVTAQTKILGSPKIGDTVDVLAKIDSANNFVAISISVSPQGMQTHLSGVVKSISATQWIIGPAAGLGPDFLVQVNADTKIVGDPKVGDRVDVLAQPGPRGYIAISITKQ